MRFHSNSLRSGTSAAAQAAVLGAMGSHRFPGSNERITGAGGDINAGSKVELLARIAEIANMLATGDLDTFANEERAGWMTAAERTQTLHDAFHDRTGNQFAELGSSISLTIMERAQRTGFMRRVLARAEVAQGAWPRIRARMRNVQAVVATGPAQVAPQFPRDQYITPNEFTISANVIVGDIEMAQGAPDLLNEKFIDGQEGIMVSEDKTLIKAVNVAAALSNTVQYFSGQLTPSTLRALQHEVANWQIPMSMILMAQDVMNDIVTGTTFAAFLEPVTKLEAITTGRLANFFGTDLVTDANRDPRLRVLQNGELYAFGSPDYVGGYTDRGPVTSEPRNNASDIPGRGWYMKEIVSMGISNSRGVAKAKRQ